VPFVSYPYEWCATMLKDATLLLIDLATELAKQNLTLQDAHPWNVLFDSCRPIYVDFGSIVPAGTDTLWPAYDEFCRFFVYPLYLMSNGYGRIARWLLHDNDHGVLKSDLSALTHKTLLGVEPKQAVKNLLASAYQRAPSSFRPVLAKGFALLKSLSFRTVPRSYQSPLDFLQQVRREVETITLPSARTEWTDYYESNFPSFSPSHDWTAKHHSVHKVLSDLRPGTVLDMGSNRGWYSQLAALLGSRVVSLDVDDTTVAQVYHDAKEKNLPITPLIMDFRFPTPGYGLCYQSFPPATERLKCDMVLALALTHHLVFKGQLNFAQIVDGLSIFTRKWLLVEFVPREDRYVREWWSERFSWYTLDNFIGAVNERFRDVRILPCYPEPRVLLLCEK